MNGEVVIHSPNMNMKKCILTIIMAAVVAQGVYWLNEQHKAKQTPPDIYDYYTDETATMVSPHSIRKRMVSGTDNFVLVDVRSAEEYEREHIVGALSVPAYVDKENSANTDTERVIENFKQIITDNPSKEVIIYCYSSSCMTGRKIGKALADAGVYVKEMTIGWNEWRFFWKQWNYPHEWEDINPADYVATGTEPGTFAGDTLIVPCDIDNEFGC